MFFYCNKICAYFYLRFKTIDYSVIYFSATFLQSSLRAAAGPRAGRASTASLSRRVRCAQHSWQQQQYGKKQKTHAVLQPCNPMVLVPFQNPRVEICSKMYFLLCTCILYPHWVGYSAAYTQKVDFSPLMAKKKKLYGKIEKLKSHLLFLYSEF